MLFFLGIVTGLMVALIVFLIEIVCLTQTKKTVSQITEQKITPFVQPKATVLFTSNSRETKIEENESLGLSTSLTEIYDLE